MYTNVTLNAVLKNLKIMRICFNSFIHVNGQNSSQSQPYHFEIFLKNIIKFRPIKIPWGSANFKYRYCDYIKQQV